MKHVMWLLMLVLAVAWWFGRERAFLLMTDTTGFRLQYYPSVPFFALGGLLWFAGYTIGLVWDAIAAVVNSRTRKEEIIEKESQ